ncbi:hypothetical protein INT47_000626 [Mucor saturninus]|uniref:Uncharacterized protein n=1 Tax=Mucor saturninus TaxID=64648 RepID=A0A8H7VFJ3_9FUNG|nr:hypothetical protein INT47_000626 [Mucor saturninus]
MRLRKVCPDASYPALDTKNLNSFTKWCSHKKLDFLQVGKKRKNDEVDDSKTARTRSLYVLKDDYLDDVAYKINSYLSSYQNYIKKLKEEGHTIIGYIRKSPGKEPDDRRCQLLKAMSLNIKERSLVDVVFASPCSQASDSMESRDKKQHALLDQIGVAGSTQGEAYHVNIFNMALQVVFISPENMIRDASTVVILGGEPMLGDLMKFMASKNKVCLVTLDYAGLSTNCLGLQEFLSKKAQIKKIIVDLFPYTNEMTVYDCNHLLEDPERLKVFNCRKAIYRRSK